MRFYERTRGQGRAGVPAGARQPGRHGQPAAHPQRAQARHRRPGRGDASTRCAERERISFAAGAAPGRRAPGHGDPVATAIAAFVEHDGRAARRWSRRRRPADGARGGARRRPATSPSSRPATDPQDETRVENLAELVAVAREFADEPRRRPGRPGRRDRRPGPVAADFLERVSLVADADQIPDDDDGRGHADDAAHREGPGVPRGVPHRLEDGVFPHMRALGDPTSSRRSAGWPTSASPGRRQRLYLSRALVRSAWGPPSTRRRGSSTRSRRARRVAPAGAVFAWLRQTPGLSSGSSSFRGPWRAATTWGRRSTSSTTDDVVFAVRQGLEDTVLPLKSTSATALATTSTASAPSSPATASGPRASGHHRLRRRPARSASC